MQTAIGSLLAKLNNKQVIITANRRLANYLQEQYAQYQIQANQSVWQTPDIISYQNWLSRCYHSALDQGVMNPKLLLTEQQELSLWEHIIAESQITRPLLQIQAAAIEAKNAWQLLWEWQCPVSDPSFQQMEDTQAFYRWAQTFIHYVDSRHWLDCSRLPEELIEIFYQNPHLMPSHMIWIGFLELNPQQQKLIKLVTEQGCIVEHVQPSDNPQSVYQVAYPDKLTELRSMARWAKHLAMNPENRIGCIIPDLTNLRQEVIRVFSEIFSPSLLLGPNHFNTHLPFNISAGIALNQYPMLYAALMALQLNQPQISATTLSFLLRSPFFGQPAELFIHIRLQRYLNQFGEYTLSRKQLLDWLQAQTLKCQWLTNIIELLTWLTAQPIQQAPSAWAQSFSKQLALLGWPGERGLNSEEYQLLQKWQEVLTQFACFDQLHPTLSSAKAWQKLHQIMAMTTFQPESTANQVQILGTIEAVGQHFSHLWIMGLHNKCWPTKPAPNPFLPITLQRERQLPHSSTQRETLFCINLLTHYQQSSRHVIVSYPQYEKEELLRPSQLIVHLPLLRPEAIPQAENIQLAKLIYAKAAMEYVELSDAPPVTPDDIIRGGTDIFKSQAICAFRAFAEYRLGAKMPESLAPGLAATERGTILHHCLETIWREIKTQQRLHVLTEDECLNLVEQAIASALTLLQKQRHGLYTPRILQIESQRLTKLLLAWLNIEKQRPSFEVVAIEHSTEVTIGGIPLTLKIDRIDKLASGEYVIIDYKTGKVQMDWEAEHFTEPQLPLYCISSSYPIAALTLAQVRNDEMKFHGLGHTGGLLPQIKVHNDWPNLLNRWQKLMEELAAQFLTGHAAIAPKDKKACALCHLELVCRINEQI